MCHASSELWYSLLQYGYLVQRRNIRPLWEDIMILTKKIVGALALSVLAVGSAAAQDYPDRAINLIVPWAAGGGTDATGRIVATLLERELGQPINVINRTGGG